MRNRFLILTSLLLLALLTATSVFAQDVDAEIEAEWQQPQTGHPGFFAGGGILLQTFSPDLSALNRELAGMGLSAFDKTLFLGGVKGFGTIKQNWRVGAYYFFGNTVTQKSVTVLDASNNPHTLERTARLLTTGGGLTFGRKVTLPKSWELEPSLGIAMGSMSLQVVQNSQVLDWSGIWSPYQGYSADGRDHMEMNLGSMFVITQPGVIVRYYAKPWLALALAAQYTIPLKQPDRWYFAGSKINGAPKVDIGNPSIGVEVTVGL